MNRNMLFKMNLYYYHSFIRAKFHFNKGLICYFIIKLQFRIILTTNLFHKLL